MILLQDVTVFLPEWEDGHFYLAKYYDKLMPMVTDNKMEKQGDLIRYIVHHFGRLDPRRTLLSFYRRLTITLGTENCKKPFTGIYCLTTNQTDSGFLCSILKQDAACFLFFFIPNFTFAF